MNPSSPEYTIIEKTVETRRLIESFRDVDRFMGFCRDCPGYGQRWGCPPLCAGDYPEPADFRYADIVLFKIECDRHNGGIESIMQNIRPELENKLLERERDGAFAVLLTGMCGHCGDMKCTRPAGKACRHPELVRPSLEALGFDVVKIARDIFDIDIQWSRHGEEIPYLTLTGALFHN